MHETLRVQVKEAMTAQRISARDLARRTRVERSTVLDFLHGRRNTGPLVRDAFCRELGLDYDQTIQPEAQASA
jgi:transcriptional regulator with XRE-family HTH domain